MPPPRWKNLVEKSAAAYCAAIEIYNKPVVPHELDHSEHSTLRELIVEHLFIGEGLRKFWRCGITDVEVARSEIDAFGYDLVMSRGTRPSYPIEDNKGRRTGQGSKGQPQAHGQAEWLRSFGSWSILQPSTWSRFVVWRRSTWR